MWNVDRNIAVGGVALATILVVLDKAGKLKGTLLLILLAVAVFMLTPVLLALPWVSHATPGSQIWARRSLIVFTLGLIWAGLSVWVTNGPPTAESKVGVGIPSKKTLDLALTPHGNSSPLLCLEVKNQGEDASITATIRIVSKSYGDLFDTRPYVGQWTLLSYKRRFGDHGPQPRASAVSIPSGTYRILEIAKVIPENGKNDVSAAYLVGSKECLQWDFEQNAYSKLPTLRLDIEFLDQGTSNSLRKIFDVGPVHAYGPLGMTEVAA